MRCASKGCEFEFGRKPAAEVSCHLQQQVEGAVIWTSHQQKWPIMNKRSYSDLCLSRVVRESVTRGQRNRMDASGGHCKALLPLFLFWPLITGGLTIQTPHHLTSSPPTSLHSRSVHCTSTLSHSSLSSPLCSSLCPPCSVVPIRSRQSRTLQLQAPQLLLQPLHLHLSPGASAV